jgi:glycosyltransferase involved in cell wall biosynthesis
MESEQPTLHTVAIIVPIYNEEEVVERFHLALCRVIDLLPYDFTIYYVNDGSTDRTQEIIAHLAHDDKRVSVVELSRNFGHQAALTAGLDIAEGEVVISLDGDGQHPPELIPQMIELYQGGYDIIHTQRIDAQSSFSLKRFTSGTFYWLINTIGYTKVMPGCADFRLMSRETVNTLKKMPEYHRFLRGMIPWMGYRSIILPYQAPERLGGQSKYSMKKMIKLAMDAIFSFSLTPLRIGITVGIIFFFLAILEIVYVLSFWLRGQQASLAPGWSSLMFVILIVGGTLMVNLGFIGIYLGYIFQEVKRRPIYIIRSSPNHPMPSSELPETEADQSSRANTGNKKNANTTPKLD